MQLLNSKTEDSIILGSFVGLIIVLLVSFIIYWISHIEIFMFMGVGSAITLIGMTVLRYSYILHYVKRLLEKRKYKHSNNIE